MSPLKPIFLGVCTAMVCTPPTELVANDRNAVSLTRAADDPREVLQLAAAELERVAGKELARLSKQAADRSFVEGLLRSPQRMADLMLSGPLPEDGSKLLRILAALWKADPKGLADRHEQTTAAAVALTFASKGWPEEAALQRYEYYRDSRRRGQLNPVFETLDVWEKRFVVSAGSNGGWSGDDGWGDRSFAWLRDNVKLPAAKYVDACWQSPYRLDNFFGESIHGRMYYQPFDGIIHAERVREVGGVCGSLSHYGANAARANGIPATTMGEPGHCAYAVRVARGKWVPAYSLSWDRSLHISLWGNRWSQLILQEECLGNKAAHDRCVIQLWRARQWRKTDPPRAKDAYLQAIREQPRHWPAWQELVEFCSAGIETSTGEWQQIAQGALESYNDQPETAWMVLAMVQSHLPQEQRGALFLRYQRAIRDQEGPVMWDYERCLEEQFQALGGAEAAGFAFFKQVAAIQSGSRTWFAPVISWGQKHFVGSESASTAFFSALAEVFAAAGGGEGEGQSLQQPLRAAIVATQKAGNAEAFQSLGRAGAEMSPDREIAAKPFPGELLSSGGILIPSSTSQWDRPESHWGVIEGKGGFFHTGKEVRPHAVVRLGKLGDVSGIVVLNPGSGHNARRQVPIRVSVSEDGTQWTEVFRDSELREEWRVDLQGNENRVQFVKVERDDDRDEVFHLSGIRVYGRRLQ